jgi:serine/threonine protein kinase
MSSLKPPTSPASRDDFDQVLKDLARPGDLGLGFAPRPGEAITHPLDAALEQALREASPAPEPQAGDVLDERYRVLGVLGRGGMGVVLEAEQLRTRKVVAIKWMNSSHGIDRSAAQVARFMREARAVANIQHSNVVDLHDVGDRDGVPFLVLERLRGESLRGRIDRGPLAWEEAVRLMLGVLSGVGAVHRAGIVHRDLKPDNIFLAVDGDQVIPKVLDFGVAAMRQKSDVGLDSLTRTGALVGTPAYMALEQLTGAEVDARADLYSLGVVLYEMLTGRLPFEARSAADLAVCQATRQPLPPSKLSPQLKGRQDALVMRALAKRPQERFESTEAFARALHESVGKRPAISRRALAAWSALLLAAVSGGLAQVGALQEQRGTPAVAPRNPRSAPTAHASASVQPGATPTATAMPAPPPSPASLRVAAEPALPTAALPPPPAVSRAPKRQRRRGPASSADTGAAKPAVPGGAPQPPSAPEARQATDIQLDDF